MKHTCQAFVEIALIGAAIAVVVGWVLLCAKLAHGGLWGLGLALSPFAMIPLGIALYKDLAQ